MKNICKKTLVISIILLLIGVSASSVISVDSESTISNNQNEECKKCNEVSKTDLIKVERLLNRVEVYSKLLLILSKNNLEIKEKIEELLDIINFDFQWPFPIICRILGTMSAVLLVIAIGFGGIGYFLFPENPLLKGIFDYIAQKVTDLSTELYEIGDMIGCWD